MAAAFLGLQGTGQVSTAGTALPITNTTGAIIAAGTLLHIAGTWDNTIDTAAPVITCSSAGGGTAIANHATPLGQGHTTTAGTGVWHQCWRALTTTDIAAGAVIATLTSDQAAVKRAAAAAGATGATTTIRSGPLTLLMVNSGTTGALLFTPTAGDAMFGTLSYESGGAPGNTPGAPTWAAMGGIFSTGGGSLVNVATYTQAGVALDSNQFNYGGMWAANDGISCIYSVTPTPVTPPPVASFTSSATTVAQGGTVTFTDTSTNTPTTWAWDFGADASPATASTQGPHTVTYSTAGTSTVTLTAGNAGGSDASDPTSITVTAVTGKPKLETLTDTFTGTVWDTAKWPYVLGTGAAIENNQAKIAYSNTWPGFGSAVKSYSMVDSSVFAKVTPTTGHEAYMQVRCVADTMANILEVQQSGALLYTRVKVLGSFVLNVSTTYSPTGDAWWKISTSGSVVTFFTSPDGVTWNQKAQSASAPDMSLCHLIFYGGNPAAGAIYVDNVNTPGVYVPPTGSAFDMWNGTGWVKKPVKMWDGSTWKDKPMSRWDGSQWKAVP